MKIKLPLTVEQSDQTRIWYVRDADGLILVDRETKEAAIMAKRRIETQARN